MEVLEVRTLGVDEREEGEEVADGTEITTMTVSAILLTFWQDTDLSRLPKLESRWIQRPQQFGRV